MKRVALLTALLPMFCAQGAAARGVSPYLPLNLDPQVERQVERLLILANKPVMSRPIPVAVVFDALPKACPKDPVLCAHVQKFLENYMHVSGVEFASYAASATGGSGGTTVEPNQHGQTEGSHWEVALAGYWQPSDYFLINAGGVGYEGRAAVATGSMISMGFDWAQLDIGYRDHWWSPMTDSAMMITTESPTMPSVTLSNYDPLALGFHYEVFVGRASYTSGIVLPDGTETAGNPKFGGLQLTFEPVSGWSLGFQRVMMWGGGAAGGQTARQILGAFFNPSKYQSTVAAPGAIPVLGKQEGGVSSSFIFPGKIPFSLYFEYAANDTSNNQNILFGKPDLTVGLHLPHVGPLDITYEGSTWSPTWYVHGPNPYTTAYLNGITNYLLSIGHWFGDQRQFGDAVGGRSNMVRIGWEPPFGGLFELQYRGLVNDSYYSAIPYYHENMGSLSYAHPWKQYAIGAQIDAGRNVFGETYWAITGFLRYGDALRTSNPESSDDVFRAEAPEGAYVYLDAGVNANVIHADVTAAQAPYDTPWAYGGHLAIGARRQVTPHQDLGAGVQFDDVNGRELFSVRAIDYRLRFDNPLALDFYFGASRYSLGTPAFGWYTGLGGQWRDILPGWDLGLDFGAGIKVARQRVLPTDPQGGPRPDAFYDIRLGSLYISKKF